MLDPLLAQPARLQIVALLYRNRHAAAAETARALELTPGNLASHVAKLEAAGYVETYRALSALAFHVRHRITPLGDRAFRAHAEALQALVAEALAAQRPAPPDASRRLRGAMLAHVVPSRLRLAFFLGFLALSAASLLLPHGRMTPMEAMPAMEHDAGSETPHGAGTDHAAHPASMRWHGLANAAGGIAALLTLATLGLPYARRAWLLRLHRHLGVAVLLLAGAHTTIYLGDGSTRGWLPGLLVFVGFAVHGATAALKGPLLRAWGAERWRIVHHGSAWVALGMVAMHVLIASWHDGLAWSFDAA